MIYESPSIPNFTADPQIQFGSRNGLCNQFLNISHQIFKSHNKCLSGNKQKNNWMWGPKNVVTNYVQSRGRISHCRSLGFTSRLLSGHCPTSPGVTNLSPLTLGLLYEEFSIHIEIVEWTVSDVPREAFTQSPSVSNNPKIPTYYLIFAVVEWTLSDVPREASQISELRTTGRKCLGLDWPEIDKS